MARRVSRKTKTAQQMQEAADKKLRETMVAAGVPEHRVEGSGVRAFTQQQFADLKERRTVIRVLYPSVADRWLADGGPGFEEPQRRAINHCRELWHAIGDQGRLVANWGGISGGNAGPRQRLWEKAEAFAQLAEYEQEIPSAYWRVYENVVRHDMAAGVAASHLARHPTQAVAAARTTVGFVASKIAEWRGY